MPTLAARKMPSLAKAYPPSSLREPYPVSPIDRAERGLIGRRNAPVSAARKRPSWTMEVEDEPEVGNQRQGRDANELANLKVQVMPRPKFKRRSESDKRPAAIDKKQKARREAMNKANASNIIDLTMDEDEDDSNGRGVKPLLLAKQVGKVPGIPSTRFKRTTEPHKQATHIYRARQEANKSNIIDLTMDEEDDDNGTASSTDTADETDELKEDSESENIITPYSPQRIKRRNTYGSFR